MEMHSPSLHGSRAPKQYPLPSGMGYEFDVHCYIWQDAIATA